MFKRNPNFKRTKSGTVSWGMFTLLWACIIWSRQGPVVAISLIVFGLSIPFLWAGYKKLKNRLSNQDK